MGITGKLSYKLPLIDDREPSIEVRERTEGSVLITILDKEEPLITFVVYGEDEDAIHSMVNTFLRRS